MKTISKTILDGLYTLTIRFCPDSEQIENQDEYTHLRKFEIIIHKHLSGARKFSWWADKCCYEKPEQLFLEILESAQDGLLSYEEFCIKFALDMGDDFSSTGYFYEKAFQEKLSQIIKIDEQRQIINCLTRYFAEIENPSQVNPMLNTPQSYEY